MKNTNQINVQLQYVYPKPKKNEKKYEIIELGIPTHITTFGTATMFINEYSNEIVYVVDDKTSIDFQFFRNGFYITLDRLDKNL